ncbi:hypothetical protein RLW55_03205 [Hyphomicrobium sp. B1]|uniref:hypothetical protein n=1 Tax=Hyphomicrobium sp. B1 TaxID=3075651 RepID=UPI003C2D6F0A
MTTNLNRLGLAVAFLVATATGAYTAPLTVQSSGEDFIAANQDERAMWGYAASRALHDGRGGTETFSFGEDLTQCLEAMLTKTDNDAGKPMQMLTGTSLSQLTALCATAMQERLDAGRR